MSYITRNTKVKEMNLFELKSVGSWLDLDNGVVYPSYANGSVDLDCPTSLKHDVLSEEWYSKLSDLDHKAIYDFLPIIFKTK